MHPSLLGQPSTSILKLVEGDELPIFYLGTPVKVMEKTLSVSTRSFLDPST